MMERFGGEHRASRFHDAGLWRMLLEKAKKGTTTEPYFAAEIVEGSLPTSMFAKLGLPARFLEHHRKKLTENIILKGPDGHNWPVMLGMSLDSKPCLLHGWVEFATDFSLAVNDQIVFFLWEDSHFLVQVFDSNHNIKRRGGGTSAQTVATTTEIPQVTTDPMIQSFRFQTTTTTTSNTSSHPASTSNDSVVATNVHKANYTTGQALPSGGPPGQKLGTQELGVDEEDDDDRVVADFNANPEEIVESFQSAPASDAEEDNWMLRMERARKNPNRKPTTGLGEVEGWSPIAGARLRGRKRKEPEKFIEEKIPEKRARQAPTDRSNVVPLSSSRRQQATRSASPPWNKLKARRPREKTLSAAMDARAMFCADAAEAREAANEEGEATASVPVPAVPASDPVTPLPVEAPAAKQVFKCPQPRNAPQQLYFSKRRPVTQQEREAALEAGQHHAATCYMHGRRSCNCDMSKSLADKNWYRYVNINYTTAGKQLNAHVLNCLA